MPAQEDYLLGTKTIVGVVNDSVYRTIRDRGAPTVYLPFQVDGPILHSNFFVAVRAVTGSPTLLAREVSDAMLAVNHDLTLTVRPIGEQVDAALAQDRVVASLAAVLRRARDDAGSARVVRHDRLFGGPAADRNRHPPGLGAEPGGIQRIVLARVAGVVLLGTVTGVGGALATARVVRSLLYHIDAHDPTTFAVTAVVLAIVERDGGWSGAPRISRGAGRSAATELRVRCKISGGRLSARPACVSRRSTGGVEVQNESVSVVPVLPASEARPLQPTGVDRVQRLLSP